MPVMPEATTPALAGPPRNVPSREKANWMKKLPAPDWLHVTLRVRQPAEDGFGLHGSGLFIINPPWTLHDTLRELMPYLVSVLGQDEGAAYDLEQCADRGKPGI